MNKQQLARTLTTFRLLICLLSVSLLFLCANWAQAGLVAPTQEIVETVLKRNWDKSATSMNVKQTLKVNGVKFGRAYKATVQEVQVEGFPTGAIVTPAQVDFTVRSYYNKTTQAVRRVREARVYKDKFDEWAVMTGGVIGQDMTTEEPPEK